MRAEDALDRPLGPARKLRLGAETLAVYVRVRRRLRGHPLPEVLAGLRGGSAGGPPLLVNPAAPFRLAWVVERVLGRLPADSRCLVRSLVLVGLLARRSVPCTLVIGVRGGGNFIAHAWVEIEGRPLLPSGGGEYDRLAEL